MSLFTPQLSKRPLGESGVEVRLGHELLDDYRLIPIDGVVRV